jgi:hypothetical protein
MKRIEYRDVEWGEALCKNASTKQYYDLPPSQAPKVYRDLRKICQDCPILNECFAWSVAHEEYGFWAGMPERERWSVRKKMNIRLETLTAHPHL